nr:hypothetical protein [Tanacetum cinerariifolium]
MLHLEGKLFDSRGCLVFVRRDYIGSSEFSIYKMTKGYSMWSIKYIFDTDDFMTPLPEGWSIRNIIWSLVVGEREEDSFLVVNMSGKVVQYSLISKTFRNYVKNPFKCEIKRFQCDHGDADLQVPLEEIKVDDKLYFVKEPVKIVDRQVKKLKRS